MLVKEVEAPPSAGQRYPAKVERSETEMSDVSRRLEAILNLSKYHREHEKYYARAPLEQSLELQKASVVLKTLADRWSRVEPQQPAQGNPYMGSEDLNEAATIQHTGVLFMEGEEEPAEIAALKRDLQSMATSFEQTGEWLARAMESSWEEARPLLRIPALADVLGERHRIIANDWQAARLSSLVSLLIGRALEVLGRVEFSPQAVRADLSGQRVFPGYLYSASELIDRAADVTSESATLVHDNERRWRVFRKRVEELGSEMPD
jgi:hypothetical protein